MTRIQGIFFDAHGVLYDRKQATAEYADVLLAECGYPGRIAAIDRAVAHALRERATEGKLNHEAYWDHLLQHAGVSAAGERAGLTAQILEQTRLVFGYPGAREAMQGLRNRGFTLGIVTDTMYPLSWKVDWLRQAGVAEFFAAIACSTVLGVHKPDPAIYLDALGQAGLRPAESAFVGHDARELGGARRAGMTTVAVHYDPDAVADYYAESLLGLLDVPIFASGPKEEPGA